MQRSLIVALLFVWVIAAVEEKKATKLPIASSLLTVKYFGRQYDANVDETTFSWQVSAQNDLSFVLALPNCRELNIRRTSPNSGDLGVGRKFDWASGLKGITWPQLGTTQIVYKVTFAGNVAENTDDNAIAFAGVREVVNKGDANFATTEYGLGAVAGPRCELHAVTTCNAGGPYVVECVNHGIRVALDGTLSEHVDRYFWSSPNGAVNFNGGETLPNPVLSITPQFTQGINKYTVDVELKVFSDYGTSATCATTITVQDTRPPTIHGVYQHHMQVECNDIPAPIQPTAEDDCDPAPKLVAIADPIESDPKKANLNGRQSYKIVRGWVATDLCGLSTKVEQTITVQDTTPPEFTGIEPDMTVECDSIPNICDVKAHDNCDDFIEVRDDAAGKYKDFSEKYQAGSCTPYNDIIYRTWTVTDKAGNKRSQTQTVWTRDTTPPILVGVPDHDITVECDRVPSVDNVWAYDNCDVNFQLRGNSLTNCTEVQTTLYNDCTHQFGWLRRWTCWDHCGNTVSKEYKLHVRDSQAPVLIGLPQNKTVYAGNLPGPCNDVVAIDNCMGRYNRDGCPLAPGRQNIQLPCPGVDQTTRKVPSGICPAIYDLITTFSSQDACGNAVEEERTVHVIDDVPPVFSPVPMEYIETQCDQIPKVSILKAVDDIDGPVIVYGPPPFKPYEGRPASYYESIERGSRNCENDYIIHRRWEARDACGNWANITQTVVVHDDEAPEIIPIPPAFINAECYAPEQKDPIAVDNCPSELPPRVEFSKVQHGKNICPFEFVEDRTWTARDACNNTAKVQQRVTVTDRKAPYIKDCPGDEVIECDIVQKKEAPYLPYAKPTVTDNCDKNVVLNAETANPGQVFVRETSRTNPDNWEETRTWTAKDSCGNKDVCVQTITVVDTKKPIIIGVPDDIAHIDCAHVPEWNPSKVDPKPAVYATDNCDPNPDLKWERQVVERSCDNAWVEVRTWTARDQTGHTTTKSQTIHVFDDFAPEWVQETLPPHIHTSDYAGVNQMCGLFFERPLNRPYNYDATDFQNANNGVTFVAQSCKVKNGKQLITTIPWGNPQATDNCDLDVQVTPFRNTPQFFNEYTTGVPIARDGVNPTPNDWQYTRLWQAQDNCGHVITYEQRITVLDCNPPKPCPDGSWNQAANGLCEFVCDCQDCNTIEVPPFECDKYPGYPGKIKDPEHNFVDDVDNNPTITLINTEIETTCLYTYKIKYTYRSNDISTNPNLKTVVLKVQDTQKPWFTEFPKSREVPCDKIPDMKLDVVRAKDNCATEEEISIKPGQPIEHPPFIPSASYISGTYSRGFTHYDYLETRYWVATDICGNAYEQSYDLEIRDRVPPTWYNLPPNPQTVYCTEPEPWNVQAQDNCDEAINNGRTLPQFHQTIISKQGANCYDLLRVWEIEDESGNRNTYEQVIHVIDDDFPVLHGLPEKVVETKECDCLPQKCDQDGEVIVTDRCLAGPQVVRPSVTQVHVEEKGHRHQFDYTVTRFWTYTDACGHTTTGSHTVTIQDTTPPTLHYHSTEYIDRQIDLDNGQWLPGVPDSKTCECSDRKCIEKYIPVKGDDNCDNGVHRIIKPVERIEYPYGIERYADYIIIRVWSVTDDSGHTTTGEQRVTVQDTTPPTPITPLPALVTIDEACQVHPQDNIDYKDNCYERQVLTYKHTVTPTVNKTYDDYYFDYQWLIYDPSGNKWTYTQRVNVFDTIKPKCVKNCPAPVLDYGCNSEILRPVTPIWEDCDFAINYPNHNPQTPNPEVFPDYDCFEFLRVWTATDVSGNSNSVQQLVKVHDENKPKFINPAPNRRTVCNDDNKCDCNEKYGTYLEPDCAAEDDCGRPLTINIKETDFKCLDQGRSAERKYTRSQCTEKVIQWTCYATDVCGNENTHTWTHTIIDDEAPEISNMPKDVYYTEPADVPQNHMYRTYPACSDNCDDFPVREKVVETIVPGHCQWNYTIVRNYACHDVSGNVANQNQYVHVDDKIKPTILDCPATATIDILKLPYPVPTLHATDNNDGAVPAVYLGETRDPRGAPPPLNFHMTRRWSATDSCGNVEYCEQLIIVEKVKPQCEGLDEPIVYVASCDGITGENKNVRAMKQHYTQVDNYVTGPVDYITEYNPCREVEDHNRIKYNITRTWMVWDVEGLGIPCTQNITVVDNVAPIITDPLIRRATYNPDKIPEAPLITATDNCASHPDQVKTPISLPSPVLPSGLENMKLIEQNWTVGAVKVEIIAPFETKTPNPCRWTLTRQWKTTDLCGNTDETDQILEIVDTEVPTIKCEENKKVECRRDVPPVGEGYPIVNDNCERGLTQLHENVVRAGDIEANNTCKNRYQLVRGWGVTDTSGNYAGCYQTITVRDTTVPVIHNIPGPVTHELTTDCEMPKPELYSKGIYATDNCDDVDFYVTTQVIPKTTEQCQANKVRAVVIHTWVATDVCGLVATATQTVTVKDSTKPVPHPGKLDTLHVSCDNVPAPEVVTFTDNCEVKVTPTSTNTQDLSGRACNGRYQIVRSWVGVDFCGNSAELLQTIEVDDTTAPQIKTLDGKVATKETVPNVDFAHCHEVPPPVKLQATDNCAKAPTLIPSSRIEPGKCPNDYFKIYMYHAEDHCGQVADYEYTVHVQDVIPPKCENCETPTLINFPCKDWEKKLNEKYPIETAASNWKDNCAGVIKQVNSVDNDWSVNHVYASINRFPLCEYDFDLTRTWTATDVCGNVATQYQTVQVRDLEKPYFTKFPDEKITVECDKIPVPDGVEGDDNCASQSELFHATPYVPLRNRAYPQGADKSAKYKYFHDDTVISRNVHFTLYHSGQKAPRDIETEFAIARWFHIEDVCGNTNEKYQTIHVIDTTAAVCLDCPSEKITPHCILPEAQVTHWHDNCDGDATIKAVDQQVKYNCVHDFTVLRTWTHTDAAGNVKTFTQTIIVQDLESPVWVDQPMPAHKTIDCSEFPLETDQPKRVSDDCAGQWSVNPSINKVSFKQSSNEKVPVCHFEALGNSQKVENKRDVGVAIRVSESGAANHLRKHEWDYLGACTENRVPQPAKWKVCHVRGNGAREELVFDAVGAADWIRKNRDDTLGGCGDAEEEGCDLVHRYYYIRTWSATDKCGKSIEHVQTVTVTETVEPKCDPECPPPTREYECDAAHPYTVDTFGAKDNCDLGVSVFPDFGHEDFRRQCKAGKLIMRDSHDWRLIDDCDNTKLVQQTVSIYDKIPPYFTDERADFETQCNKYAENRGVPKPSHPGYADQCIPAELITFNWKGEASTPRKAGCVNDYTHLWTITDTCENSATQDQVVHLIDTLKPEITNVPANINIQYVNPLPARAEFGTGRNEVHVEDLCDPKPYTEYKFSPDLNVKETCPCDYQVIRTWVAIDCEGNTESKEQLITVLDTTAPELQNVPKEVTEECSAQTDPTTYDVRGTDNCDRAKTTVQLVPDANGLRIDGSCKDEFTKVYTWRATDPCGNTKEASQTVHVKDRTPPKLVESTVPKTYIAVSIEAVPPLYDSQVQATDNCANIQYAVPHETKTEESQTCKFRYTLKRWWTATDNCGNEATARQNVEVDDKTPPVWLHVPENHEVEYPHIPEWEHATATDNSEPFGGEVHYHTTQQEEYSNDKACTTRYTIKRITVACDDCQNCATYTQLIKVTDNTPPVCWNLPPNAEVECDNIPAPPPDCPVVCYDNGVVIPVTFSQTPDPSITAAPFQLVRKFYAVDGCGNYVSHTQVISVQDNTAPVLSRHPKSIPKLACNATCPPPPTITAVDNCVADIEVKLNTYYRARDGSHGDNRDLVREWSATDGSNTATHIQVISLVDESAPYIVNVEDFQSTTIECDNLTELKADIAHAFVEDNCDLMPEIKRVQSEPVPLGRGAECAQNYQVTRTWTMTDKSGNSDVHTQVITVQDTTPPQSEPVPMTCIWPPNGKFAVFKNAKNFWHHASDNCGSITVVLTHCNSTQPSSGDAFPADCHLVGDDLYVLADRNGEAAEGRFYTLGATLYDDCQNPTEVAKKFWVPFADVQYAKAVMTCVIPTQDQRPI